MKRVGAALGILVVDFLTIGVPLAACVMAYVILARPTWFKAAVDRLYAEG
mgnify:CR=1 FL=1